MTDYKFNFMSACLNRQNAVYALGIWDSSNALYLMDTITIVFVFHTLLFWGYSCKEILCLMAFMFNLAIQIIKPLEFILKLREMMPIWFKF